MDERTRLTPVLYTESDFQDNHITQIRSERDGPNKGFGSCRDGFYSKERRIGQYAVSSGHNKTDDLSR